MLPLPRPSQQSVPSNLLRIGLTLACCTKPDDDDDDCDSMNEDLLPGEIELLDDAANDEEINGARLRR